jgi:hypothetical protein
MTRIALIALLLTGCNTTEHKPAPAWTCPGPCGNDCRCANPRDCDSKTCSTKPPPYPLPVDRDGYAEAYDAVERGQRVTLSIGITGGDYHTDAVPGVAPGVYDCSLEAGRPVMRPQSRPVMSWPVASPCANGRCPNR